MSDDRRISADLNITTGADTLQTITDLHSINQVLENIGDSARDASQAGTGLSSIGKGAKSAATGARGLSQAVRVFGGETSSTATAVLGLIPLLSIAATGISAVSAALASLNIAFPPFAAVAAAAAVVVGTVAAVTSIYNDHAEEQAKRINAIKDATIAYNEALGSTTDEIEDQIATNEELRETNLRNQEATRKAIKDLDEPTNVIFGLADGLGLVGAEGDDLADELEELEAQEASLTTETQGLEDALNSVEVAANDARAALLSQVDQQAELRQFEQQALAASAEQNAARAEAIANEKTIVEEQIAILEASGDTSKEVQDRIAELNEEMETLNAQTEILNSNTVKAAEAQKAQAEATLESAEAAKEMAAQERELAKERVAASQAVSDAQDKQTASMREFIVASASAGDELIELQTEQNRQLIDLATSAAEEEEKIQRDIDKRRKGFEKNQGFLRLFDLGDGLDDEKRERDRARSVEFQELREELAMEREEKRIAAEAEQEDKLVQIQQEAILTGEAIANEQKLLKDAADDNLKILDNRFQRETQAYEQVAMVITQILSNVTQFAQQSVEQVDQLLSQPGGASAGGDGWLESILDRGFQELFG